MDELEQPLERIKATISRRKTFMRAMGHITATYGDWDRIAEDLELRRNEMLVPVLCGDFKIPFLRLKGMAVDVKTPCKACEEILKVLHAGKI